MLPHMERWCAGALERCKSKCNGCIQFTGTIALHRWKDHIIVNLIQSVFMSLYAWFEPVNLDKHAQWQLVPFRAIFGLVAGCCWLNLFVHIFWYQRALPGRHLDCFLGVDDDVIENLVELHVDPQEIDQCRKAHWLVKWDVYVDGLVIFSTSVLASGFHLKDTDTLDVFLSENFFTLGLWALSLLDLGIMKGWREVKSALCPTAAEGRGISIQPASPVVAGATLASPEMCMPFLTHPQVVV